VFIWSNISCILIIRNEAIPISLSFHIEWQSFCRGHRFFVGHRMHLLRRNWRIFIRLLDLPISHIFNLLVAFCCRFEIHGEGIARNLMSPLIGGWLWVLGEDSRLLKTMRPLHGRISDRRRFFGFRGLLAGFFARFRRLFARLLARNLSLWRICFSFERPLLLLHCRDFLYQLH
jgi:hypothetical protein